MGRNSELIRQWTLLQQLAAVRTNTIPQLSVDLEVSTRTVRRDLASACGGRCWNGKTFNAALEVVNYADGCRLQSAS